MEAAGRGGDGLGADLKRPGHEGGRSHDANSWAAVAARPNAGGSEARGDEDGADKRGPGVSGRGGAWATVAGTVMGWRGLLGRAAEARGWAGGWRGAGPRGGEKGELGWGYGAGPSGEKGRGSQRADFKKGEEK